MKDEELLELLKKRYAEPVIPACRICGIDLSLGKVGGGEPSMWHCSKAKRFDGTIDWQHFNDSTFFDISQGGDPDVIELIKRYKSAVVEKLDAMRERNCPRVQLDQPNAQTTGPKAPVH